MSTNDLAGQTSNLLANDWILQNRDVLDCFDTLSLSFVRFTVWYAVNCPYIEVCSLVPTKKMQAASHMVQQERIRLSMQDTQEMQFNPWDGKIPWSGKWQLTTVLLPGKLHGQGSLVDYSPWGRKESAITE